jgi:hypothetical protein
MVSKPFIKIQFKQSELLDKYLNKIKLFLIVRNHP